MTSDDIEGLLTAKGVRERLFSYTPARAMYANESRDYSLNLAEILETLVWCPVIYHLERISGMYALCRCYIEKYINNPKYYLVDLDLVGTETVTSCACTR